MAAREQFLSCAREQCPAIVRKSCSDWLSELGGRIPSVVVRVQEAGQRDVTDARVKLDGEPVKLDGRPVALDPGTHALEVEARGERTERSFLIAEREQGRLLVLELPAPAPAPAALPLPPPPIEPPPSEPTTLIATAPPASFSVPTLSWVLGGIGVVGVATFSVLRIQLGSELRELERTCSPTCSDSQRDDGKRKALIADLSLGVGIAALAGGVAWTLGSWLARPDRAVGEPSAIALSVVPTPGGVVASFAARY